MAERAISPDQPEDKVSERPEQAAQQTVAEAPPDRLPTNLTGQLTSFIGRDREMAEVKRLLTQTRLLTLVGAGGCGKTRLALQVATELLADYSDGVGVVELAALTDPALVPQVVAFNLDIREEPSRPILTTLVLALRSQCLLLVLDNCEHLIEACARLADILLRYCPNLQILATSREPLGIGGEVSWRVPSLPVPQPEPLPPLDRFLQYEGVRLFSERAAAVLPGFRITPENAPAVARVCYRLDGIPLALELAAVRVKALSVEQIAARLDDRFRLLTGGSRIDLPRHQTLRALVDWSHDLLSEPEKMLFRRLAVFLGGWTLEAAEAVCAGADLAADDVLGLLAQLVDKSLVVAEEGREERYRFLETLQQYAAEKLRQSGEEAALHRRHQSWCLALAEQAEAHLGGSEGVAWADRLEAEHDNLRVALERSKLDDGGAELGLRLTGALWPFWELRGYWSEGRRWLESVLAVTGGSPLRAERAKALHGAASLADAQGDQERATALLEEALALHRELGDTLGIAFTLGRLGQMAYRQGDPARALSLAEESLTLFREVGDPVLIADALDTLGHMIYRRGDSERAAALFEESLALCREAGDQRGQAAALRSLVDLAEDRGDYARAAALAEKSVTLYREVGDTFGVGALILAWALAAAQQGDYQRAEELLQEGLAEQREVGDKQAIAVKLRHLADLVHHQADSRRAISVWKEALALHQELGDEPGIAECLAGLARVAGLAGQPERAIRLFAAADSLRAVVGEPLAPANPADSERLIAAARTRVGEEAFAAAWAEGRAMSPEQAIAEALAVEIAPAAEAVPTAEVAPTAEAAPTAAPSTTPGWERSPGKEGERGTAAYPAGLTRREVEVLRLIAAGRTNNEIAAELVISVPTVERHITHIYEKIGARGRGDAATFAVKQGLV